MSRKDRQRMLSVIAGLSLRDKRLPSCFLYLVTASPPDLRKRLCPSVMTVLAVLGLRPWWGRAPGFKRPAHDGAKPPPHIGRRSRYEAIVSEGALFTSGGISRRLRLVAALAALCSLCILVFSVASVGKAEFALETERYLAPQSKSKAETVHELTQNRVSGFPLPARDFLDRLFLLVRSESNLQGPELDYSTFNHTSQRHASLACTACHQRPADNSTKPAFPGHPACINCHGNQFFTPSSAMCTICHSDVNNSKPPLKGFPANFKERFNVKFDHAQHMNAAVRPKNGCAACHSGGLNRGVALSIPTGLNAHNQCYVCHTPSSKSPGGRDLASCGVCHDQKGFARTSTNATAFRAAFSHAKHGPRQRLECAACHLLTAGLPQGKQVSSPRTAEHFLIGGQSCLTCHNGKRSFGGDLAFKDCRRCHAGATFRMP